MSERWPAIVLQRPEHRIGVNLVGRVGQKPSVVVAAEVVTERGDLARATGETAVA